MARYRVNAVPVNPKDLPAAAHITSNSPDWIARARALTPLLAAAGPRIDANKALPPEVLDALHEAKMFRMFLPQSIGGDAGGAELDLPTFFEVILAIAEGDASAAWSVAQSNGCAFSAAYMEPDAARAVFGDARAVTAWGFPAAPCHARPVDGGWRVTGTWGFGSGSRHASWVGAHCNVCDAQGVPLKKPDGSPIERTALIPRSNVTITDAGWNVIGLRGTGSDTYTVKDMFVPAAYCIVPRGMGRDQQLPPGAVPEEETERRESGPLYRVSPSVAYQAGFSAVALGIARAMLNDFTALASKKTPASAGALLRDNSVIQARVATSEARLASMRAWLLQILRASWEEVSRTGVHSFDTRVALRLASTYAVGEARKVADDAYDDCGATAIFEANPFERRLRDIRAVTQQLQSHSMHLQTAGQHYLGLTPNTRFF